MFTKNTARQQGAMLLLVNMLQLGKGALQTAVAQQQQQMQHLQHLGGSFKSSPQHANGSSSGGLQYSDSGRSTPDRPGSGGRLGAVASLRIRTSLRTQQQAAPGPAQQLQQLESAQQAAQLQLLAAAVAVLEQLCHGCHANQAAAASEGLIDQLAGLAALALGGSLEAASPHAQLLAAAADALAAAVEFCVPNKLLARESGGVDVLARLLLMAAEVRGWG
jgi:cytochrome c5